MPDAARRPLPSRAWLIALACALAAFALRAAYLSAVRPPQDTPGLAVKYLACARHLLAGEGFFVQAGQAPVPYVDRLPGYCSLLAGIVAVLGTSQAALALAHAAIGSLQASAAALVAARLRGSAWAAGLLVAAWPPLWKSDVQLVETGTCGVVVTLLVATALARPGAARDAALALLAVAAALLRPDYLLVPLMVAGMVVARREPGRLRIVAMALGLTTLACSAWALRNARVAEEPFVTVGLGTNLLAAVGESAVTEQPSFGDQQVARSEGYSSLYWPHPKARDRERTRRALALMRAHPAATLKGALRRVAVTLSMHPARLWPGPSAEDEIRRWRLEHPGRPRYEGLARASLAYVARHPARAAATFAWAPLALGLAASGAWRLRERRAELAVVLALPAYAVLVHLPLHAEPRYFFPFIPLLLALGGAAWPRHRDAAQPAPAEA